MSWTDMNATLKSMLGHELTTGVQAEVALPGDEHSTWVNAPRSILQSALAALSHGRVSDAVVHFDDRFKFNYHALGLEFTNKARLTEFLDRSRELFPDSTLDIVSVFEDQDHAIAQWQLSAAQTVPYGSISYRTPISLSGSTIVRVEKKKIVEWSDYYDQNPSRRINLAALFTERIEY